MFETLPYFEKQQTLAFHKVGEIYSDPVHPIHGLLIGDSSAVEVVRDLIDVLSN
jgi:hypothetical protein